MPKQPVVSLLESKKVPFRLLSLREPAFSVDDVVRVALEPVARDEICKTLLVKTRSEKFAGILLRGSDRLDFQKAKEALGESISLVKPKILPAEIGVPRGAVCPLLLKIPLWVDQKVMEMPHVNFGSGDLMYGIEIAPKDLWKVKEFEKAILALG